MRAAALIVATLAALASAAGAAVHAGAALVALLAALAFTAIAVWAGATAIALHAPDNLTEPRHRHGPSLPPPLPSDVIARRGAFGRLWWLTLGAFGIAALVPLVSLGRRPRRQGTAWSRGARLVRADGTPLHADDLVVGAVETVFPHGHVDAQQSAVLLLRLDDGLVQLPPDRAGWAPHGNVAYSKICTHAGCPVAIYRRLTYQLYCPCHQSVFEILFGARPSSGPATRALPQLGLDVDAHGYLIARGDFAEPVGPDEWWRRV